MARKKRKGGRPKLRTESHVIADLSVNFLERRILKRRHQFVRMPAPEYGIDGWMFHFSSEGYPEDGHVYFQLKATNKLQLVDNRRCAAARIESTHLQDWWQRKHHPVILILYDAVRDRAFWLDVQAYCDEVNRTEAHYLTLDQETVTVHIPVANKLTVRTVDYFRKLSLSRMN